MSSRIVTTPRTAAGALAVSFSARRVLALSILLVFALLVPAGSASSTRRGAGPGAAGIGDPYYPLAGNGGYEVGHYALDIGYHPHTDRLNGETSIEATATQALSRFNLDLVGLRISSILVNDTAATWTREQEHELVVTPAVDIANGAPFTVVVRYAGRLYFTTRCEDRVLASSSIRGFLDHYRATVLDLVGIEEEEVILSPDVQVPMIADFA